MQTWPRGSVWSGTPIAAMMHLWALHDVSPHGGLIAQGHAALKRADWDDAQRLFSEAATQEASGDALDGLAWAVWWRGDADGVFDARRRAYRAYRKEGSLRGATRVATCLGRATFVTR